MTTNKGLFTSERDDWETPQEFFDKLEQEFHFGLDPCATDKTAKCKKYFTKADDGLKQDWLIPHKSKTGFLSIFMNPPYGRDIGKWLRKANDTAAAGATVVCLVPARTDTTWWWSYCQNKPEDFNGNDVEISGVKRTVRFIKGRLKFSGKGSAPFPSAIVILEPERGAKE